MSFADRNAQARAAAEQRGHIIQQWRPDRDQPGRLVAFCKKCGAALHAAGMTGVAADLPITGAALTSDCSARPAVYGR